LTSSTPRTAVAAVLLLLATGCGGSPDAAAPTTTTSPATTATSVTPRETGSLELGPVDRRARLVAPDDVTTPAPLLVVLHGYSGDPETIDAFFGATAQASTRGLYVLLPIGTPEPSGKRFWDATSACCNFTGTPVDDVEYLAGVIEDAVSARPIDPDRVYVLGHSNGGFMAYRLACERADLITAVASLAGSEAPTAEECTPSRPVSVLQLHGTEDRVIRYDGGKITAVYPGARETVARWADRGGCDGDPVSRAPIDLELGLDGVETTVVAYGGCADGIDVQLATITGGAHTPNLDRDRVGTEVIDWLLDHSR
jgi:polyhydroxybutyrate depolymerase